MNFKPVQKLNVSRTLSTGKTIAVGVLPQNRQGVFFQYDEHYRTHCHNLSPFTLKMTAPLQAASKQPHNGLHGVFADSLPDGWGLLLQDRIFRQQGILPGQVTAMDRLALIGGQGMGALTFSPESTFKPNAENIELAALGLEAETIFNQALTEDLHGQTQEVLATLVAVGSSGGARPKATIFSNTDDLSQCSTVAQPEDEAWLVKFTSKNLPLGHEEGLCEAVYLQMAANCSLEPPTWQLVSAPKQSGACAWLAVKRFDYLAGTFKASNNRTTLPGRLHMHTACGLLDADFRTPSLDYVDLIKASKQLCKAPSVGQLQFRRAIFNLFAANQDDHSKNWSFVQQDNGQWQLAPFYDATFSPHPFNEHATAFDGYGQSPPLKTIQKLASHAGFSSWQEAQHNIQQVVDAISDFATLAQHQGIHKNTISAIQKRVDQRKKENRVLLGV